ncbi:MAG: type 4a pilus biogenesis protein PilO [Patescibacteria group bacterium]
MKKNNSTSSVAFAILIIGACFIFSWQMLVPQYKQNKEKLLQLNSEVNAARDKLDSLKAASDSLTELGTLVDQMLVAVPKDADQPNLITELEAIGAKNQVVIPAVSVTDSEIDNSITIGFSINGSFAQISSVIASLEKDIRFMNMQSLSIADGGNGAMSLSVQIKAYKQTSGAGSTTGTQSLTESVNQ